MKQVFTNQTVDGNSTEFSVKDPLSYGGQFGIILSGGFGGGTATLEVEAPDGGFVAAKNSDGADVAFTEAGLYMVKSTRYKMRLVLAGATASTLDAWVEQ